MTVLAVAWQARANITTSMRIKFFIFNFVYSPNPILLHLCSFFSVLEQKYRLGCRSIQFGVGLFQTKYISILLMEQKYHHQVGENRSRSARKLENQYKVQNLQSYDQFVKDFAAQIGGRPSKENVDLLYCSTATQNGEIQTLQSIKQHRKSVMNCGGEAKINEKSLHSVVNQIKEKTNLASFPNSLLSINQNNLSSELTMPTSGEQVINLMGKELQNEKIKLTDFQFAQKNENITEYLPCSSCSQQNLQRKMLIASDDIKTLKLIPKNKVKSSHASYSQFGCQTELLFGSIQQFPTQNNTSKKIVKNVGSPSKDQYHHLYVNETPKSSISLEEKCEWKLNMEHPQNFAQKMKKNQQQNEEVSFESQKQDKLCIWEKDFFQLQHEDLNRMQQRDTGSQTGSDQNQRLNVQIYAQKQKNYVKQLEQLRGSNQILNQQLLKVSQLLKTSLSQEQQLQDKNKELQVTNSTINERLTQLLQEYQELICLVQQYKQKTFDFDNQRQTFQISIVSLQKQVNDYQVVISRKDEEITYLQKQLKGMKEEYCQLELINVQLEQVLRAKSQQLQDKMQQMQKEKVNYNEVINFYKERLNNEGITMNVQELKYIKDFIESQREEQSQKIQNLENHCKKQLSMMEKQKEKFMQVIAKLKQQKEKLQSSNSLGKSLLIQTEIEAVIKQYDRQLQQRDEEIVVLKKQLKKQTQYQRQFCFNNCADYINHVKGLRNSIFSSNSCSNQKDVEFVYVVDKLLKINFLLGQKNKYLQQEKTDIILLMQKLESFYQQEVQSCKKQLQFSQLQKRMLQLKLKDHQSEISHRKVKFQTPKGQPKTKNQPIENNLKPVKKNDSHFFNESDSQPSIIQTSIQNKVKILRFEPMNAQKHAESLLKFKKINIQRNYSYLQKLKIAYQLCQALQNKLKNNKKLESIFVSEIYLRENGKTFEVDFIRKDKAEQDSTNQKQMLYFAPEVLLGFTESQQSYIWTLGLLLDELFQGSLFYKKVNEIKSRTDNYYCRNGQLQLKGLLQAMLKKNHKVRTSLQEVKDQVLRQINCLQNEIDI